MKDNKKRYVCILKEINSKENITIVNIYAVIIGASKYIKQILTDQKGEIDNTIIVEDFNILLSIIGTSSRQKTNKEILDLNHILDQIKLADIYRTFHLTGAEYTFFQVHTESSRIQLMLSH